MAYRVTSVSVLGEGVSRYVDMTPDLRAKFDEYVSAGKATVVSSNSGNPPVNEEGKRVATTITDWTTKADYDEYQAWVDQNHGTLINEYILSQKGGISTTTQGEEI